VAALAGARARPALYSYRSDPRVPPFPDDRPIFIFDAYCVLCSRWVELVLRYDRAGRYRLLSAQSALGRALYVHYGLDPEDYETNILLINGVALMACQAIIERCFAARRPMAGARAATADLELEDYDALFARRTIYTGTRTSDPALAANAGPALSAADRSPASNRRAAEHRRICCASALDR
jgi:predicted DCC family thiol-disulfide oxidoreductase YuxK